MDADEGPRKKRKLLIRRYRKTEVAIARRVMTTTRMILRALTAIFLSNAFSLLDELLADRRALAEGLCAVLDRHDPPAFQKGDAVGSSYRR